MPDQFDRHGPMQPGQSCVCAAALSNESTVRDLVRVRGGGLTGTEGAVGSSSHGADCRDGPPEAVGGRPCCQMRHIGSQQAPPVCRHALLRPSSRASVRTAGIPPFPVTLAPAGLRLRSPGPATCCLDTSSLKLPGSSRSRRTPKPDHGRLRFRPTESTRMGPVSGQGFPGRARASGRIAGFSRDGPETSGLAPKGNR